MAPGAMMMVFLYFGLLWLSYRRNQRCRRRRRRLLAARRQIAALFDDHERELSVMALIVTNSLTFSTMQRRSVWTRQRSRAFMEITSGWDEREWKRNFRVSKPTFLYLCSKLHVKLQRTHKARAPISVETKVVLHCGD